MTARSSLRPSCLCAALALAQLLLALPAMAQDPPARAGRIAYLAGPVSFSPAGTSEWAQAPLNRPLVAGDRLWTEPGARDEAQFGPVIARMDGGTLLNVLAADEGATQLQLAQGRIDLHVRRVGPGETVEIDTPNLAFVARAPGDYRIAVAPDGGSTDVAALRGTGDVYGDGNAYRLGPGQGYRFAGQDLDSLGAVPIQPYDDFDRWAFARDRRLDHAQSARFVPADVVGYEDLDDYGAWRVVPDYGTVWVPTRVAADWAPYHSGHWAWIDPWGWTWVDDQPWGYAVSHYGRWAHIEGRWAWVPAPPRERAVFAPALVAFVGAALALGGAGQGPGVGWFPLGPREAYRPSYHASPAYIERVNVSNTRFQPGMLAHALRDPGALRYANRGVPGAVMAMPSAQFAQAVPVNRAARPLPPRLALGAPLAAAPGARPLPQSRIGTPPARALPPPGAQQRIAVVHGLPHGLPHGAPLLAGLQAGPAPGRRAGAPVGQPGRAASLRMLRPAQVRPGVPPPHAAGAPQFAARHGVMPSVPPASSPYPAHGQGAAVPWPHREGPPPPGPGARPAQAAPAFAFAHERHAAAVRPDAAPVAPHVALAYGSPALGRSGMQETRAGAPERRPAAQYAAPGHAEPAHAHPMPAAHAMPAAHVEAPHAPAPQQVPLAAPAHPQPAAPPHPQPPAPPHPQPPAQPQPPAHPQPAPPHPQVPAPHPEPAHPQPQAQAQGHGGGHEGGKDHGHGH